MAKLGEVLDECHLEPLAFELEREGREVIERLGRAER